MAHSPQFRARSGIIAAAIAVPTAAFVLPMSDRDGAIAANRIFSASAMASDVSSGKRAGLPVLPVAGALTVDSDFEDRFGFLVPQPFSLDLPDPGDGEINVAYPDTADGVYLRISISTLADGLVEELDVVPLRIGAQGASARRHAMSRLFITRVFADLTQRYINKSLEGVSIYALSGTHAVVLNGTYWDPRAGDIAVRIYGIMPALGENGLIFYERRYAERAPASARFSEQIVRSVTFQ
ncbi:hypothetical protein [Roseitalea porphyridii]|jgi:hypothetical protein|uniref:hypothetical protein n=1 Tax=Roseitalea porphyridii TaxID=1852022 RepID=UPI0032F03087